MVEIVRCFCEMYGYSEEELTSGFSLFQLVAPKDRDMAIAKSRRVVDEMRFGGIEYTGLTRKGVEFHILILSSYIQHDDRTSQLGIAIDFSPRMQGKEEA